MVIASAGSSWTRFWAAGCSDSTASGRPSSVCGCPAVVHSWLLPEVPAVGTEALPTIESKLRSVGPCLHGFGGCPVCTSCVIGHSCTPPAWSPGSDIQFLEEICIRIDGFITPAGYPVRCCLSSTRWNKGASSSRMG